MKELDEPSYCMLLHLSVFCGYLLPAAGIIVPIVLWLIRRDDSPVIDQHGRIVVNAIISYCIYVAIAGLLCLFCLWFIAIPIALVLMILSVIFPIVGAVKAKAGEAWHYPGTFSIV